jgi:hypothetical protein
MKKFVAFLLIVILGYLLTSFGPWYLIAIAGFVGGLVLSNQWKGLLIGFLAGFILWAIHIYAMSSSSQSDLPARIAKIFTLPNDTMLLVVSALVGGLVTGFGAAAGGGLRKGMTSK